MKPIKQNLGVDVDSKELKVSFQLMMADLSTKIKGSRTFKNHPDSFVLLQEWIEKKRVKNIPVHVTMEATGVYYENIVYYLHENSLYQLHVILGNTSRAYLASLNLKSKTDEIDAKGLAKMGLERHLKIWQPVSNQLRNLKKLSRERLRITKEKTMILNQLHAEKASYAPFSKIVKRYEDRIVFLEKQLSEIEKEQKKIVRKDPEFKQRIENVCTAKGIGFITAVGVVSELNGFVLFKNRNQLVSYAGYDVVTEQSGTSIQKKHRISKKGNSFIRQMLYMSAMSAAVNDPHHRQYYYRICEKTGIKMKANVAIQRKLLLLIYTLFTNNIPYDPEHHQKIRNQLKSKKNKNLISKTPDVFCLDFTESM